MEYIADMPGHPYWQLCSLGGPDLEGMVVLLGALSHGARTVRARCAHGSMFLGWLPNLYPVEWPP